MHSFSFFKETGWIISLPAELFICRLYLCAFSTQRKMSVGPVQTAYYTESIVSLWRDLNESLSPCIYIYSWFSSQVAFATVSNSAVSLPATVHGHNHRVLLELVYSVLFWTVTLFEVSLINIQRSVRHHFESVAQWLRPSFLFKVFWENPYCPSPAWWRWLEK